MAENRIKKAEATGMQTAMQLHRSSKRETDGGAKSPSELSKEVYITFVQ